MSSEGESLKTANDSGFPLQIAVERQVSDNPSAHGWRVRHTEHSWVDREQGESGFIDLVLQNQHNTIYLVLECKRVRNATWVFLHPDGISAPSRQSKAWVTNYGSGRMLHYGWHDVIADPPCPEGMFCAIRGQSANEKQTMLERTAAELVTATEALATEERDLRSADFPSFRMYFSVIITTAELKIAEFNPSSISLSDGLIPEANVRDVPYVRFRKQLSQQRAALSPIDYSSGNDLNFARQSSLFVVNAAALPTFLRAFNVASDGLRRFHSA